MKDMQNSDSQEREIRDFVNDCRILHKISLSSVKILLYSEMSNNFLPEVLLRITSEIQNVTNLYNKIAECQEKLHQLSYFQDTCSIQMYSYEIWMQRIVFQLDALLSSIKKIVYKLLKLYISDSLITAIRLISFYNNLITTYGVMSKDTNHMPKSSLLNQDNRKKFTIPRILKIVAYDRTEECAYTLIQFLIKKYNDIDKINSLTSDLTDAEEDNNSKNDDEDVQHESDNTSILVYKTLTQYDSPTRNTSGTNIHSTNDNRNQPQDIATATFIISERKRLDALFSTIVATNPQELLTEQELAISKRTGCIKICSKVKQKLVEIYEQILWQNIGISGEHMLLWWTDFGLGKRNQLVAQKFNAWLKQYFSTDNVHITVQPTIYSLLDCLCCFITSTSWDELFTQSLISANNQHSRHDLQNIGLGTKTGHLFSDMLYDIVFLTNSCEGSNWTQQDLENLPLVEQIPLLHRLDHTIHSVRIWAMGRAKYLTNCWNMEQFFRVTHVDVNASLYALSLLKLTQNISSLDHENSHFVVCSKMKAKLVSEVNVNIEKLHEVPNRSLKILASVCKITSLAYLKICFPSELYWQQQDECAPNIASDYVEKYLDEILKPVLLASQNLPLPVQKPVSKLILEILCEAWLDHIYNFRIKFSKWGAIQLLVDFGAIPMWIKEKVTINNEIQSFLTADEILRRCEGVGRLLLRHPGESIVMSSEQDIFQTETSKNKELENVPETLMPPEMYVPNQEKWLELRLDQQKLTITTCC